MSQPRGFGHARGRRASAEGGSAEATHGPLPGAHGRLGPGLGRGMRLASEPLLRVAPDTLAPALGVTWGIDGGTGVCFPETDLKGKQQKSVTVNSFRLSP